MFSLNSPSSRRENLPSCFLSDSVKLRPLCLLVALDLILVFLNSHLLAYESSENMTERIDTFPRIYEKVMKTPYRYDRIWMNTDPFNLFDIDQYYLWPSGTHFHAFHQEKNKGAFAVILKDKKTGKTTAFSWGDPTAGGRIPNILLQEDNVTALASAGNYFIAILENGKSYICWGNIPSNKFSLAQSMQQAAANSKIIVPSSPPSLLGITSNKNTTFIYTNFNISLIRSNLLDPKESAFDLQEAVRHLQLYGDLFTTQKREKFLAMTYTPNYGVFSSRLRTPSWLPQEGTGDFFFSKTRTVEEANDPTYDGLLSTAAREPTTWGSFFYDKSPEKVTSTENGFALLYLNRKLLPASKDEALLSLPAIQSNRYIESIAATDSALAAILDDGSIQCWGNMNAGGTTPELPSEWVEESEAIFYPYNRKLKVTLIAATRSAFVAILDNGGIFAWGSILRNSADDPENKIPAVPTGEKAVSIATTDEAAAILLASGKIICFGNEKYGGKIPEKFGEYFLSDPQKQDGSSTNGTTRRFSRTKKVIALASTSAAFSAILEDGTLFCWGDPCLGGTTPGTMGPDQFITPALPPNKTIIFMTGISPFNNEMLPTIHEKPSSPRTDL